MSRKILDVFELVGNSTQVWDFIQLERDWQALGVQMDIGPCNLDVI